MCLFTDPFPARSVLFPSRFPPMFCSVRCSGRPKNLLQQRTQRQQQPLKPATRCRYVDPELGFYHQALGSQKPSLLQLPSIGYNLFQSWRAGFSGQAETATDGFLPGGVLVVAAPGTTESGRPELLLRRPESVVADSLARAPPEEQALLFQVLGEFSRGREERRRQKVNTRDGEAAAAAAAAAGAAPAPPPPPPSEL
jgi:hypothetical protein